VTLLANMTCIWQSKMTSYNVNVIFSFPAKVANLRKNQL
jgi:hypothetical protein